MERKHKPNIDNGRRRDARAQKQQDGIRKKRERAKQMKRTIAKPEGSLPLADKVQNFEKNATSYEALFEVLSDPAVPPEWIKDNISSIRLAVRDMTEDLTATMCVANYTSRNDMASVLFDNNIVKKCLDLLVNRPPEFAHPAWVIIGNLCSESAQYRNEFLTGGLMGILERAEPFDDYPWIMCQLFTRTGTNGNELPPFDMVKKIVGKFRDYTLALEKSKDDDDVVHAWLCLCKKPKNLERLVGDQDLLRKLIAMGGWSADCMYYVLRLLALFAHHFDYHAFLVTKLSIFDLVRAALKTTDLDCRMVAVECLKLLCSNPNAYPYFFEKGAVDALIATFSHNNVHQIRNDIANIVATLANLSSPEMLKKYIFSRPRMLEILFSHFMHAKDDKTEYNMLFCFQRLLKSDVDNFVYNMLDEEGCLDKIDELSTSHKTCQKNSMLAEEIVDALGQREMDVDEDKEIFG